MTITIEVNIKQNANLAYLEKILGELPAYLEKYLWYKLLPVAQAIASEAQSNAPVKTGYMRDHIYAKITEYGIGITCDVPYAIFQELGTKYILPKMFIHSAFYAHEEDIRQTIIECIEDYFREVKA